MTVEHREFLPMIETNTMPVLEHKAFLDGRIGAADSDIDALVREFGLAEAQAVEVYREWFGALEVGSRRRRRAINDNTITSAADAARE